MSGGEPRTWAGRRLVDNESVAASAVAAVEDAVLAAVRHQVERLDQLETTWEGDKDWILVVKLSDVLAILDASDAASELPDPAAEYARLGKRP